MNRKHYEMLASDWGQFMATIDESERGVMEEVIARALPVFEIDNPAFDRERFFTRLYEVEKQWVMQYDPINKRWVA